MFASIKKFSLCSKILFWLTQISFITTSSKYVVALLLSADVEASSSEEQSTISVLLITLDIFFLISSALAIMIAIWILRVQIKQIQKDNKAQQTNDLSNATAVIIDENENQLNDGEQEDEELNQQQPRYNDFRMSHIPSHVWLDNVTSNNPGSSSTQISPAVTSNQNQGLRRVRSTRSQIIADIHEEHRKSQINLDVNIKRKARKQKRKTQLRVQARSKLKKQKVINKIPAFASLTEQEIDAMLECMTRELFMMGDILCKEGDVADTFYIVMKGECIAYGKKPGETIKTLGSINQYEFFGEASLLSEPGVKDIRKATVEVESEFLTVMVLTKKNFYGLIDDNKLSRDVLEGVKKVDLERQEQNLEKGEGEKKKD